MSQNIYDDEDFFAAYSNLRRSIEGLDGAPEWPYLRAMLPDMAGRRVLDLGCGFGWFSRWAAEAGAASVLGIDLSQKMLERARSDTDDPTITYRQADLDDLEAVDLPRGSFDIAYSSLALHYLADLPRFMTTLGWAVVSGGAFVFSIEHPVYTAPIAPRFVTDDSGRESWLLDHYSVEGPRTTDWLAPGVLKYHRTISTYISCLQNAGFTLERFCEWAPQPEEIVEFPEWTIELDRPQFLLIGARRT